MSNLTPICVKCRVEMRCAKNAFVVRDAPSGPFPSTYWKGDLFECPMCGAQIVTGFGTKIEAARATAMGIAEGAMEFHYEPKGVPATQLRVIPKPEPPPEK